MSVLLYYPLPYAFHNGSLSELGPRLEAIKSQQSSCICPLLHFRCMWSCLAFLVGVKFMS